jgi:hypothetical protein
MRKILFGSLALAWVITILFPASSTAPASGSAPAPAASQQKPAKPWFEAQGATKQEAKFLAKMAEVIRAFGYDCARVDKAFPFIMDLGFDAYCTGRRGTLYHFSLEDHGGKWRVSAD